MRSLRPFDHRDTRFCVFEHIYFARPDSVVEGRSVYEARKRIGAELARESPVDADIVVPVPDSGVPAAIGYAQESGLPFELGIIRNHYVGRTFIEPTDQIRHLGVRLKHNASRANLTGKRVILVDDSIVRGTTSIKIVEMVRRRGSACGPHADLEPADAPPMLLRDRHARARPVARRAFGCRRDDRVDRRGQPRFPIDRRALPGDGRAGRDDLAPRFCDACFTGDYPIPHIDADNGKVAVQLSLLAAPV